MAKNRVQFQKGIAFLSSSVFTVKRNSEQEVLVWRCPRFLCDDSVNNTYCRLKSRPRVLQYNRCRHRATLTPIPCLVSTEVAAYQVVLSASSGYYNVYYPSDKVSICRTASRGSRIMKCTKKCQSGKILNLLTNYQ